MYAVFNETGLQHMVSRPIDHELFICEFDWENPCEKNVV